MKTSLFDIIVAGILMLVLTLVLTACGPNCSSFEAADKIRTKYPGAELKEITEWGGVVTFMVRLPDGTVMCIWAKKNAEPQDEPIIYFGPKNLEPERK